MKQHKIPKPHFTVFKTFTEMRQAESIITEVMDQDDQLFSTESMIALSLAELDIVFDGDLFAFEEILSEQANKVWYRTKMQMAQSRFSLECVDLYRRINMLRTLHRESDSDLYQKYKEVSHNVFTHYSHHSKYDDTYNSGGEDKFTLMLNNIYSDLIKSGVVNSKPHFYFYDIKNYVDSMHDKMLASMKAYGIDHKKIEITKEYQSTEDTITYDLERDNHNISEGSTLFIKTPLGYLTIEILYSTKPEKLKRCCNCSLDIQTSFDDYEGKALEMYQLLVEEIREVFDTYNDNMQRRWVSSNTAVKMMCEVLLKFKNQFKLVEDSESSEQVLKDLGEF